jgi:hypothetical protein
LNIFLRREQSQLNAYKTPRKRRQTLYQQLTSQDRELYICQNPQPKSLDELPERVKTWTLSPNLHAMKSVTAPILISTKLKGGLTRVIAIARSGVGLLSDCVRRLNTAERRHEQIFTRVPLKMTCVALLRRRLKYRKRIVTCTLDHICFHGLTTLALVPYFYLIGSSLNYSRFEITFA